MSPSPTAAGKIRGGAARSLGVPGDRSGVAGGCAGRAQRPMNGDGSSCAPGTAAAAAVCKLLEGCPVARTAVAVAGGGRAAGSGLRPSR